MTNKKNQIIRIVERSTPARKPKQPKKKKNRSRQNGGKSHDDSASQLGRSIADPWSFAGCIPDGARGVGCFTVKENYTLTTAGAGSCYAVALQMSPDSFSIRDTGSGFAIPAWGANWTVPTATATINSLYGKVRPISGGIRVVYTGNSINDQGLLFLGQMSGDVPISVLGVSLSNLSNASQFYRTFPLRSGGSITWRPEEMDDVAQFVDTVGIAAATSVKPATPYLVAVVYGAATAGLSSVLIELVGQFQGQYVTQNFTPGGPEASPVTSESEAQPGWYERAKNIANMVEPIMPYVKATAMNLLEGAISTYGPLTRGMRGAGSNSQRIRFREL